MEMRRPWGTTRALRAGRCMPAPVPGASLRLHAVGIALGLIAILSGCAARSPHQNGLQTQANLPERTTHRLISVWEQRLSQYISVEGDGDPAVLARMRTLHSRDTRRPARITFDALDVD